MVNKNTVLLLAASLALVGACTVTPPSEDPVLIRLDELDQRIEALERILANGSLVDLTLQMDELQRQSADLQGRTEDLEHQSVGTAERQRDIYTDLDNRIQDLERNLRQAVKAVSVIDGGQLAPGELPVPGGTDRDNYQAAFELLKEQRYEPAAMAFRQFLVTYPDSQLADNAQYWLAESYYVTDQFNDALEQFSIVINKYPRSRKVPDALLKMGYCSYELEHWEDAREALSRVQSEYPDTTAARLAEQRLKRMTDEGH
ncbi:MAG: tol-pal system protein YbgF [Gammaproteobacteria bacterium]|nr:tol-pal system protein YbgF [Gammaproteobacteria bacterium]